MNPPSNRPHIELLDRLEREATQGPWRITGELRSSVVQTSHITRDVWQIAECFHDSVVDSEFIATARNEMRALLDYVKELEGNNANNI